MNRKQVLETKAALRSLPYLERQEILRTVFGTQAPQEIEKMAVKLSDVRGLGLQTARELLAEIGLLL